MTYFPSLWNVLPTFPTNTKDETWGEKRDIDEVTYQTVMTTAVDIPATTSTDMAMATI